MERIYNKPHEGLNYGLPLSSTRLDPVSIGSAEGGRAFSDGVGWSCTLCVNTRGPREIFELTMTLASGISN